MNSYQQLLTFSHGYRQLPTVNRQIIHSRGHLRTAFNSCEQQSTIYQQQLTARYQHFADRSEHHVCLIARHVQCRQQAYNPTARRGADKDPRPKQQLGGDALEIGIKFYANHQSTVAYILYLDSSTSYVYPAGVSEGSGRAIRCVL